MMLSIIEENTVVVARVLIANSLMSSEGIAFAVPTPKEGIPVVLACITFSSILFFCCSSSRFSFMSA